MLLLMRSCFQTGQRMPWPNNRVQTRASVLARATQHAFVAQMYKFRDSLKVHLVKGILSVDPDGLLEVEMLVPSRSASSAVLMAVC